MAFRRYPEEIEKLFKICEPYEDRVENGELKDAPPEVIEAFEKTKNGLGNRNSRYHQSVMAGGIFVRKIKEELRWEVRNF